MAKGKTQSRIRGGTRRQPVGRERGARSMLELDPAGYAVEYRDEHGRAGGMPLAKAAGPATNQNGSASKFPAPRSVVRQ